MTKPTAADRTAAARVLGTTEDRAAAERLLRPVGFPDTDVLGIEGYCVPCRAKRPMQNIKEVALRNGKPAVKGICSTCGADIFRLGSIEQNRAK